MSAPERSDGPVLAAYVVGALVVIGLLVAVAIVNGYSALVGLQLDEPARNVSVAP